MIELTRRGLTETDAFYGVTVERQDEQKYRQVQSSVKEAKYEGWALFVVHAVAFIVAGMLVGGLAGKVLRLPDQADQAWEHLGKLSFYSSMVAFFITRMLGPNWQTTKRTALAIAAYSAAFFVWVVAAH